MWLPGLLLGPHLATPLPWSQAKVRVATLEVVKYIKIGSNASIKRYFPKFTFLFVHNPKKFMKFQVCWILKTKGNKFLTNVKTRWISIFLWWNKYTPNSTPSLSKCPIKVKWMKLHWKPWMIYVTLNSLLGYFTFICDFIHSIKLTQ
jgi:hypothetical protein